MPQEIRITRRLGEIIVLKAAGRIDRETAERIRLQFESALARPAPVIVIDDSIEIEVICTPASMHADYSARFGDA